MINPMQRKKSKIEELNSGLDMANNIASLGTAVNGAMTDTSKLALQPDMEDAMDMDDPLMRRLMKAGRTA